MAGHVQTVAKEYNSPSYQEAADNFRIPYWDFSSIPTMPSFVNTELVTINTPTGQKDVANPLLTYVFQEFPLNPVWFPNDSDSSTDNQLSQRPKVLRFPNQDGISQPDSINSNLNGVQFMKNTVGYHLFMCLPGSSRYDSTEFLRKLSISTRWLQRKDRVPLVLRLRLFIILHITISVGV